MDTPTQHAHRADILNFMKAGRAFSLAGPCPQKIKPASKKNPYRLQGRCGATSYLQGSARYARCRHFFDMVFE